MDHKSTALGTKIKKNTFIKGHFVTPLPHEEISRSFDSHCTAYKNKNKNKKRANEKKSVHKTKKDV